jgi:hypothetical protein
LDSLEDHGVVDVDLLAGKGLSFLCFDVDLAHVGGLILCAFLHCANPPPLLVLHEEVAVGLFMPLASTPMSGDIEVADGEVELYEGSGVAGLLNVITVGVDFLVLQEDEHHAYDITGLRVVQLVNDQASLSKLGVPSRCP